MSSRDVKSFPNSPGMNQEKESNLNTGVTSATGALEEGYDDNERWASLFGGSMDDNDDDDSSYHPQDADDSTSSSIENDEVSSQSDDEYDENLFLQYREDDEVNTHKLDDPMTDNAMEKKLSDTLKMISSLRSESMEESSSQRGIQIENTSQVQSPTTNSERSSQATSIVRNFDEIEDDDTKLHLDSYFSELVEKRKQKQVTEYAVPAKGDLIHPFSGVTSNPDINPPSIASASMNSASQTSEPLLYSTPRRYASALYPTVEPQSSSSSSSFGMYEDVFSILEFRSSSSYLLDTDERKRLSRESKSLFVNDDDEEEDDEEFENERGSDDYLPPAPLHVNTSLNTSTSAAHALVNAMIRDPSMRMVSSSDIKSPQNTKGGIMVGEFNPANGGMEISLQVDEEEETELAEEMLEIEAVEGAGKILKLV